MCRRGIGLVRLRLAWFGNAFLVRGSDDDNVDDEVDDDDDDDF